FEANEPSRLMVWRGPRAKYHVTLSVSPSTWHAAHEPHAEPFGAVLASDQRPRPVLKKRLPFRTFSAAEPAAGRAELCAMRKSCVEGSPAMACELNATAVTSREPSSATKANALVVWFVATPMGMRMSPSFFPVAGSGGFRRSMKTFEAPTSLIAPV